jgi:dethiobiotin synthetase
MRGLFVTGTDTGVGKTLVSAALLHGLARAGVRAVGMKPVASGCRRTADGLRSDDALLLVRHSNVSAPYGEVNPIAFEPAIAPHIAAAEAGERIDLARIVQTSHALAARADRVVVEGVGGWRVPLNEREDVADLARLMGLPVVLVVGLRLGCLNHARLTADALVAARVPWAGWVASAVDAQFSHDRENLATLRSLMPAPLLGVVPHDADASVERASMHLGEAHALLI